MRDPAERMASWFRWKGEAQVAYESFASYVEAAMEHVDTCIKDGVRNDLWPRCVQSSSRPLAEKIVHSLYVQQLRAWVEQFDPSQFLVIPFTGLVDPLALKAIYLSVDSFLGFNARKRKSRTLPHQKPEPTPLKETAGQH